jgi:hypothetical protein
MQNLLRRTALVALMLAAVAMLPASCAGKTEIITLEAAAPAQK